MGKDYVPWILVGEFGSKGRCTRAPGIKSGRIHHLFSDLEERYYNILEWQDSILDIREQFPLLPVSRTEQIASILDYLHPKCIGTALSFVMTTDFLITVKGEDNTTWYEARSVKYAADLKNKRVAEKQEIEEKYWEDQGVKWKIVNEKSFSEVKAKNIAQLLGYYKNPLEDLFPIKERIDIIKELIYELINRDTMLKRITQELDIRFGLPAGSCLSMFYYLAAHKVVPVNLEIQLTPSDSISKIVNVHELQDKKLFEGGKTIESYA